MDVSFPTDTDGFLTQECPSCQQQFKLIFGEGSEEPVSYCPYCGFEGRGCWWTQSQADYISAAAANVVLGPELKELERSLKSASGGLFKVNLESNVPNVPPPPMDVEGTFKVFRFPCCNETIKADRRDALFCVICGKQVDMTMSESTKVFLSHKSVDKTLVTEFRETLRVLGYEPWMDEDAMPAGTPLERGLLKGMQDSCGVVFFITPSFKDEGFLETEVNYAVQEKRTKGDRFSIIALQFVADDGSAGVIPDLLNNYVWKKPRTHLDALREIVRALPVQASKVDWREGIQGVVQTPKVKSRSAELSHEGRTILLEASAGNGRITHSRHMGGEEIATNGKSLIRDESQRTRALWVGGLEDLVRRRFIRDCGHKGEVFEVTREGYEAADEMRPMEERG